MKSASSRPARHRHPRHGRVHLRVQRVFTEAKLEHPRTRRHGFLSLEERDLAERAYLAGTTPEMFASSHRCAEGSGRAVDRRPARREHMSFGAVVKALREKAKCGVCSKTTLVFDVSAVPLERRSRQTMFRPERVSVETHCACPGGPAHHLLQQAVAS
jgi:hypothetical protein